jgi:hypothetical protein
MPSAVLPDKDLVVIGKQFLRVIRPWVGEVNRMQDHFSNSIVRSS